MKNRKIFVFVIALVLFAFIGTAKAGISAIQQIQCEADLNTTGVMNCEIKISLTSGTIATGKELKIALKNPTHILDNKVTVTAPAGWTIDGEASKIVTLGSADVILVIKRTGAEITTDGVYTIVNASYEKSPHDVTDCGFEWSFFYPKCEIKDGVYYGLSGQEITGEDAETKWKEQCGCGKRDDKYYDPDGKEITEGKEGRTVEEEMNYLCYSCTAPDKEGNYYYNGKKLDDAGYAQYCAPKCKVVGDDYYGKDGNKISKEEYQKTCMCRVENDKYYDDNNNEITAEQYQNMCQPNVKTGSGNPYYFIALGGIAAIGIFFLVKNKNKFKKI